MRGESTKRRPVALFGLAILTLVVPGMTGAVAPVDETVEPSAPPAVRSIRVAETSARSELTDNYGIGKATSLAYLSSRNMFVLAARARGGTRLVGISSQDVVGNRALGGVRSPSLAPTPNGRSLVAFDTTGVTKVDGDALFVNNGPVSFTPADLGITDARGATVGPDKGTYVLDGLTREIVAIPAGRGLDTGRRVTLPEGVRDPRGLAYNQADGLMYVGSGARVVAVEGGGHALASFDLTELGVEQIHDLAFAPSADPTDDPSLVNLFALADTGGASHELVEVAVRPEKEIAVRDAPVTRAAANAGDATSALRPISASQQDGDGPKTAQSSAATHIVASLIKTIDLSLMVPNSPDTAGVAYIPSTGDLMLADSEVEEITSQYVGVNLWRITRNGGVVATGSTSDPPNSNPYSKEPTGLGFDPSTGKLYFSDDDADKITAVRPGTDGIYGSDDDDWTAFSTKTLFPGNSAPDGEGIAFDPDTNTLWIIDGVGSELYNVTTGGSYIGSLDTAQFGAVDPEGLAYNADTQTLLVLDHKTDLIYELNKSGALLRTIDVSAANAVTAAGLELAPSPSNPGQLSLWIVDRGVDNGDGDTTINDGKLFEMSIGGVSNFPPAVTITAPAEGAKLPAAPELSTLSATANDIEDGDRTASITWSSNIQGALPAGPTVDVALQPGLHTLTASATDLIGAIGSSSVKVFVGNGPFSLTSPLTVGAGDVEQKIQSGAMSVAGSDLELGADGGDAQAVGLRFLPSIPKGAFVKSAYVQFTVDENSSSTANLSIRSQDSPNAPAFTGNNSDVTNRPKTAGSVGWNPPQWSGPGTAGPAQRTPDLWPILDNIFVKEGWEPGNGLVLIVTGTGTRTAKSFEAGAPAVLHMEFQFTRVVRGPAITITSPAAASEHPLRRPIAFTGTAIDQVTGTNVTASLNWSSDKDGPIGKGGNVSKPLSKGTHNVTVTAIADSGDLSTKVFALTVKNHAPTIKIDSPTTGSSFPVNSNITFTSTGFDADDGNLAYRTDWKSNRDGPLGRGSMISARLSNGTHIITATAKDTDGSPPVSDSVTITVASQAPTVAITTPQGGSSHHPGLPITFGGTASDPEQGNMTSQIQWSSSADGVLGTGGTIQKVLSNGTHTITARVTDNTNKTGTATVSIEVKSSAATVIDLALASAGDDAEEIALIGTVSKTSGDLDLVSDQGRDQIVGLRYALPVPQGATINDAWIQFTADATSDVATSLSIRCQDIDNAPVFHESLKNISLRTLTTAEIAWEPAAWIAGNPTPAAQAAARTPDLSEIIQEVIDRPGWTPGNAMAFIISGTGMRTAESFESGAPPLLHVDWD